MGAVHRLSWWRSSIGSLFEVLLVGLFCRPAPVYPVDAAAVAANPRLHQAQSPTLSRHSGLQFFQRCFQGVRTLGLWAQYHDVSVTYPPFITQSVQPLQGHWTHSGHIDVVTSVIIHETHHFEYTEYFVCSWTLDDQFLWQLLHGIRSRIIVQVAIQHCSVFSSGPALSTLFHPLFHG